MFKTPIAFNPNSSALISNTTFVTYLTKVFQPIIVYSINGELYCKVNVTSSKRFLLFLKYHTNTLYKQLIDLYGVDYMEKLQRFELCYSLLSLSLHRRINVTVSLSERQIVDSISTLYPNSA